MPITYSRTRSFILRPQMMGMGRAPSSTSVKMLQAALRQCRDRTVSGSQPGHSQDKQPPDLQTFQYTRSTKTVKDLHRGSNGFIHWNSHQPEYGVQ